MRCPCKKKGQFSQLIATLVIDVWTERRTVTYYKLLICPIQRLKYSSGNFCTASMEVHQIDHLEWMREGNSHHTCMVSGWIIDNLVNAAQGFVEKKVSCSRKPPVLYTCRKTCFRFSRSSRVCADHKCWWKPMDNYFHNWMWSWLNNDLWQPWFEAL